MQIHHQILLNHRQAESPLACFQSKRDLSSFTYVNAMPSGNPQPRSLGGSSEQGNGM